MLFVEDDAVGYALYRPTDPDSEGSGGLYLRQFFIARDRRRSGSGRRAFACFRKEVLEGRPLRLEVLRSNPGGEAFWRACGLVPYCTTYTTPAP